MTTTFVEHYWRGQGPLWKIYWLYGVLGSSILTAVITVALVSHWVGPAGSWAALGAAALYTVWILVGTWRCAYNVSGEPLGMSRDGWALLARMLTVAWAINVVAAGLFAATMLG